MHLPKTLKGYISVDFGIDRVYLLHKVHGRFSEMELGKGDLIKVKKTFDSVEDVSAEDILLTIVNHTSKYQGCVAEVTINPNVTRKLERRNKMYAIKKLFEEVEMKEITHEKASEIVMRWESAYEESELD